MRQSPHEATHRVYTQASPCMLLSLLLLPQLHTLLSSFREKRQIDSLSLVFFILISQSETWAQGPVHTVDKITVMRPRNLFFLCLFHTIAFKRINTVRAAPPWAMQTAFPPHTRSCRKEWSKTSIWWRPHRLGPIATSGDQFSSARFRLPTRRLGPATFKYKKK